MLRRYRAGSASCCWGRSRRSTPSAAVLQVEVACGVLRGYGLFDQLTTRLAVALRIEAMAVDVARGGAAHAGATVGYDRARRSRRLRRLVGRGDTRPDRATGRKAGIARDAHVLQPSAAELLGRGGEALGGVGDGGGVCRKASRRAGAREAVVKGLDHARAARALE